MGHLGLLRDDLYLYLYRYTVTPPYVMTSHFKHRDSTTDQPRASNIGFTYIVYNV